MTLLQLFRAFQGSNPTRLILLGVLCLCKERLKDTRFFRPENEKIGLRCSRLTALEPENAYFARFLPKMLKETPFVVVDKRRFFYGGEGEIRTLATVSRPTPLAGAPLHRLEYFSVCSSFIRLRVRLAERVGFEPTARKASHWFSRPAP